MIPVIIINSETNIYIKKEVLLSIPGTRQEKTGKMSQTDCSCCSSLQSWRVGASWRRLVINELDIRSLSGSSPGLGSTKSP